MSDLPNNLRLWIIHGSTPKTDKTPWRSNKAIHVLAETASRAIATAEARIPGIQIHSLAHKGQTADIFVDDFMPPVEVDRTEPSK